jgi:trans-2,3-dihydro-3-hydroxyanthranilate isomerase
VTDNLDRLLARRAPSVSGRAVVYTLLDVFTDKRFEGNQLAVVTDARAVHEQDMQRIASELHLSETVFILAPERGGDVRIRIFTPGGEFPFAGHPVLGTAILVGAALGLQSVTLETPRGLVPVRLSEAAGTPFGWMQQPIPTWQPYAGERELLGALGAAGSLLPVEIYDNGPHHVYVALDSEAAVAELAPDLGALARLGEVEANCFAGGGTRWKTRMFAPALGVPEDPATGSAAGPLALHLARHGRIEFGQEIEIVQGVEIGRPSRLYAKAQGSVERIAAVEVGGAALTVGYGQLLLE